MKKVIKKDKLGTGLKEEYEKYQTAKNNEKEPKEIITNQINNIELLIGQEKLKNCYEREDIIGFINEMSEYMSKINAIRVVLKYKHIHELRKQKETENGRISLSELKISKESYEVYRILRKALNKKYHIGDFNYFLDVITEAQSRK